MSESAQVVVDARFNALVFGHTRLEKLWTGARWAEGPAYFPAARHLIFSDIPNNRLMRYNEDDGSVSVFRTDVGYHNGHTVDAEGRLVCCEHGGRAVSRVEHDGSRTVLASHYQGKRLNSPNDVVVKSDGSIWFSDPTYGIDSDYEGHMAPSEIGASNVYRIAPATGDVSRVVTDLAKPNGLAFSPDESLLYVADTGQTHDPDCAPVIRAYPVQPDGASVGKGRLFATCEQGLFDGFRVDIHGNVWSSAGNGVHCFAPDGTLLGKILLPEICANLTFGGQKRNRLYIMGQTSLYSLYVNTRGLG